MMVLELINLASRQQQASLSRLIPLQRMSWALSEGLVLGMYCTVSHCTSDPHSVLLDAHRAIREFQDQWLRDFCEVEVNAPLHS